MPTTKAGPQIIKRNPFEEPPVPRSFYHPGSPKRLSKHERKTALSPDRRNAQDNHQFVKTSHEELFLSGSHRLSENNDPSPKDSSSKFDESWPSSERPSLGDDSVRHSQFDVDEYLNLKKRLEFPERDSLSSSFNKSADVSVKESEKGESTLAKYIDRFRRGVPMSREERRQNTGRQVKDFWWLSASPPTSDIRNDSLTSVISQSSKHRASVSPQRISSKTQHLTASQLASYTSAVVPGDEETRLLQEKADRLLEMSCASSELSSGPAVSTEGLGSSSSSVITDRSEEKPYRPAFTRLHTDHYRAEQLSLPTVSSGKPMRPEDDILYQWRLKRKMDLAKDSAHLAPVSKPQFTAKTQLSGVSVDSKLSEFRQKLSEFSQRRAPLSDHYQASMSSVKQPSVTTVPVNVNPAPQYQPLDHKPQTDSNLAETPNSQEQIDAAQSRTEEKGKVPPIASPTLHKKAKVKLTDPQPHLHLMCDILPCPHQEEYCMRMRSGESEDSEDNDTDTEEADLQYKQYLQAERPDSDRKKRIRFLENSNRKSRKDAQESEETEICDLLEKDMLKYSCNDKSKDDRQSKDSIETAHVRRKGKHKHYQVNTKDKQSDRRKDTSRELRRETTPPALKRSSSPKGLLDSAIGQVVKDYLFESSQSVVGSSVESLPTEGQRLEAPQRTVITDSADSVEISSDGEEFAGDSILQQLRQQRAIYENQLREIDEMLMAVVEKT